MQNIFTFNELKEKYGWTTTEKSINKQIRYALNRGVEIEFAEKRGKTYFKILNDKTAETWVVYPNDNYYEVTKSGKVRTVKDKKIVGSESVQGYIMVTNTTVQPTKYYRVHRMVMETFAPIENSEEFVVDHINGNRKDNRFENLRWVTQRQNMYNRDENWAKLSQNLQKLVEKHGYDYANELILSHL